MSFNADRRGSSRGRWQTLAGWILAAIGVAVFLGGNLGARIGFTFLPFDPHHAYAQLGVRPSRSSASCGLTRSGSTEAISRDEGGTWTRVQVANLGAPHHEAGVAADKQGNIYYLWIVKDRLSYLVVSTDRGKTCSEPQMVAAPGVNEASLPSIAVGDTGGVAISYMGTTESPGPTFRRRLRQGHVEWLHDDHCQRVGSTSKVPVGERE